MTFIKIQSKWITINLEKEWKGNLKVKNLLADYHQSKFKSPLLMLPHKLNKEKLHLNQTEFYVVQTRKPI